MSIAIELIFVKGKNDAGTTTWTAEEAGTVYEIEKMGEKTFALYMGGVAITTGKMSVCREMANKIANGEVEELPAEESIPEKPKKGKKKKPVPTEEPQQEETPKPKKKGKKIAEAVDPENPLAGFSPNPADSNKGNVYWAWIHSEKTATPEQLLVVTDGGLKASTIKAMILVWKKGLRLPKSATK